MDLKSNFLVKGLAGMSLGAVLALNFVSASRVFASANTMCGRYQVVRQEFTDEQDDFYDQYDEYLFNNPIAVSCPGNIRYDKHHKNYNPDFDESCRNFKIDKYIKKVKEVQRNLRNLAKRSGRNINPSKMYNFKRSATDVSDPECREYDRENIHYHEELDSSSEKFDQRLYDAMNMERFGLFKEEIEKQGRALNEIPTVVSTPGSAYYDIESAFYDRELDCNNDNFISEKYYAAIELLFFPQAKFYEEDK